MTETKPAEAKQVAPGRMRRDALTPPAEFAGDAIVWAAWLYYEEGLTQEEIARTLGISRGSVVTMLQEARENGTVSISVATAHLRGVTLARAIMARFGIAECLVVPGDDGRLPDHERVGHAAAKLLSERLRPDDVLGVSWGRTVLAVSQAIPPKLLPGVSVVQITGSAIGTYRFSAEACASNIANRIGGRCIYLHAPGIVSSPEVKQMLMREPTLVEQFRIMSSCNRIIFGVGSVEASSTAFDTGFLSPEEGQPYRDRGAVAVLAGRFIDTAGCVVSGELDDRLIGMTIPDIAQIPERICVAAGHDKAAPIHALLTGGYVTVLVTDEATARQLLDLPERSGA
ncbi:sugar-binding transcriptional regulator [Acidisoma silvae]|uniref:Sugar-binding transcriptional regulator n=1 Tax=Acidisoma silvae TaxID=2802396 RepID=A0A963YQA9_9PROT|nr:sugar-binding transcriptional regulator [Acidisoma silvae]MCB8875126.1 sugar-binding transcriptional regulator [Acidisoma silvae]